jgi:hypothetical protein
MKMTQYLKWKADSSKGEVFTPIELVCKILDKIPEGVWRNPKAIFLDPCMGKGTFLLEIVRRLVYIYGYTEDDAKSRVYGYDVRVKYINHLTRRGLKNVRHKDFLNEVIEMEFDVVLGNPPYQSIEDNRKINGGINEKLWMPFLYKSISLLKKDGFLGILVPTTWAAGAKNPHTSDNIFQDIIKKKDVISIDMNSGNYFNVGIGISTIILKNCNRSSEYIKINWVDINIDSWNILPKKIDSIILSIFHKISQHEKFKFSFVRKNFKKNELSTNFTEEFNCKTYVGKEGFLYSKIKTQYDDLPKVLIHRMTFGNGQMAIICDNDGEITPCYSNVYLVGENETASKVKEVIELKLYQFIFNNLKYTQYNESRALSEFPKVPLNIDWTNDTLYEFFGLTDEEIQYIDSNVE